MSAAAIGHRLAPIGLSPPILAVFSLAAEVLRPPPHLTMTQWAERNFVLSSEDSAKTGPYRVARAPYQAEILDSILDPRVDEVVLQCAAQTVKTLAIKIWLSYFVIEDPSPILFMLPTLDLAKRVSRQRLAPMFRDVPLLHGLLAEGSRKSANSVLEKSFPGGVLFMVGANSPAGICSVPIRIFMADEINRNPASAGAEGSPLGLGDERLTTFWNAKKVRSSTPTDALGPITVEYEKTDMRQFHVPCPHCTDPAALVDFRASWPFGEKAPSGYQVLDSRRLIYGKDWPYLDTVYACRHCGAALAELDKPWMLRHGRWIPRHPEIVNRRGYQLSGLYSPFRSWPSIAEKWRDVMKHREDKNRLKVFVNTVLAEPYNDDSETLDSDELMGRCEDYPCPAPDGVTLITAGIDVQGDRIELLVRGWGKGQESWLLDLKTFEGNTSRLEGEDFVPSDDPGIVPVKRSSPWQRLDAYLERAYYLHARGVRLPIACTFIDSGFLTTLVLSFCKVRAVRWIYACKGVSGFGKAPLAPFSRNNRMRVRMYPVAVDEIKATIYRRLKLGMPGAGYLHFSRAYCDKEYFAQLTCEQLKRKLVRGYRVRYWEKPPGARNEALDKEVYAYAAFLRLGENPDEVLEVQREALLERAKFAAQARRSKPNPDQLPLLPVSPGGDIPETPEPAEDVAAPAAAPSPTQGVAQAPPDVVAAAEGLSPSAQEEASDNEYKVAEALDQAAADPEPEKPHKVKIRKSWI